MRLKDWKATFLIATTVLGMLSISSVAKADEPQVTNNDQGDNSAVAVTKDAKANVVSNDVIKNGWQ